MEEIWKEYRLGSICSLNAGGDAPKNVVKHPCGDKIYPIYSNGENERGLYGYTNFYKIDAPAVTISARGNIGFVCYRKENFVPIVRLITAKANEIILSNEFLYYCLCNTHIWGDGSVQKQLTVPMISEYEVKIPSKPIQNKIVFILKTLDDKIDLNQRINDNLEQQAHAIFKSWFVDFEPFKDGDFVESELGMIPKGWDVKQLGDVTVQQNEKVKARTDVKVLSPVTTGELVLSEEYFTKQVYSESVSKYIVVKPHDFAYNPARVNIGSLGMNEFDFDGCVSPVYVVFRCEDDYQYYFDLFRHTENFKKEVKTRAIGGVRQSLGYKDFSLIKVVYPPKSIVEDFNMTYTTMLTVMGKNKNEIFRLAQLRDTLLPRLMSGELKVN